MVATEKFFFQHFCYIDYTKVAVYMIPMVDQPVYLFSPFTYVELDVEVAFLSTKRQTTLSW